MVAQSQTAAESIRVGEQHERDPSTRDLDDQRRAFRGLTEVPHEPQPAMPLNEPFVDELSTRVAAYGFVTDAR